MADEHNAMQTLFSDTTRILSIIYQHTLVRNDCIISLDNSYYQFLRTKKNAQKLSDLIAEMQNKERGRQQIEDLYSASVAPNTFYNAQDKYKMHIERIITSIHLQSAYNKVVSSRNIKSYQHCLALMECVDILGLINMCPNHRTIDLNIYRSSSTEYTGSIVEKQVMNLLHLITTPSGWCIKCLYKAASLISRERINVKLKMIAADLDYKIFYEGPEFLNKVRIKSIDELDELQLLNLEDSYYRKLMMNNCIIKKQIQQYIDAYSIRKGLVITRVESADSKRLKAVDKSAVHPAKKKKKLKTKAKLDKSKVMAKAKASEYEYEILPLDNDKEKRIETQLYKELESNYIMDKLDLKKKKLIIIRSAIIIQRAYKKHIIHKKNNAAKLIYKWYSKCKQRFKIKKENFNIIKKSLLKRTLRNFIKLAIYKIKIRKHKLNWQRIMEISSFIREIITIQARFRGVNIRKKYALIKHMKRKSQTSKEYHKRYRIKKEWETLWSKKIASQIIIHQEVIALCIQRNQANSAFSDQWTKYEKSLKEYCYSDKSTHMKSWVKQKGKHNEEYWLNLDTMTRLNDHPGKHYFDKNKDIIKNQSEQQLFNFISKIDDNLEFLNTLIITQGIGTEECNSLFKKY